MNNTATRIGSALFVSIFALGLSLYLPVRGQEYVDRRSEMTLRLANANPRARSIARKRYQFMYRLEAKYGLALYKDGESSTDALFPMGRADRVYFVLYNAYWPPKRGTAHSFILCFQRKNGTDKLIYQIPLEIRQPSTKMDVKTWNLLGYLNKADLVVKGNIYHISRYARSDLMTPRDCVVYEYDVWGPFLEVGVISSDTGEMYDEPSQAPLTNADLKEAGLKEDEFYQTYGLPVTKAEMPLFGITASEETGTHVK